MNKFDTTPSEKDNHINFAPKLLIELLDKYADHQDIKELLKKESAKEICTTNWYEKFRYKYN